MKTVFLSSKIRKNRSFSVWAPLLTAIFWTFSPAFIISRAVKERWGLSRTESVLIFKIGKREPLFFSTRKLLVVAEFQNGALWASGLLFFKKAHVHPNGFARLCFCFEMILLSNAVFWLASTFGESCVTILKTTARETSFFHA